MLYLKAGCCLCDWTARVTAKHLDHGVLRCLYVTVRTNWGRCHKAKPVAYRTFKPSLTAASYRLKRGDTECRHALIEPALSALERP
jgi:hypothetical protein